MIDLHIHTIASDGQHTGREIVEMARSQGLTAIAIADHNSVESVGEAEAAALEAGIEFASCVELDTIFRGRDLHVLGYFIDYDSEECKGYMREIFEAKLEQTRERVRRLRELGFLIDFDLLMEASGGRLPYGVEYMRVLLMDERSKQDPRVMEYVTGARSNSPYLNFYLDWLRTGRPAFVPLNMQAAESAVARIKKLNGVPVLAHPSDTPVDDAHALIDAGLEGLEVYSSYHDRALAEKWLGVARARGLLITAGSDFHGKDRKPDVKLAGIDGNRHSLYAKLRAAAEARASGPR